MQSSAARARSGIKLQQKGADEQKVKQNEASAEPVVRKFARAQGQRTRDALCACGWTFFRWTSDAFSRRELSENRRERVAAHPACPAPHGRAQAGCRPGQLPGSTPKPKWKRRPERIWAHIWKKHFSGVGGKNRAGLSGSRRRIARGGCVPRHRGRLPLRSEANRRPLSGAAR